ncbi:MAG: AAA family ATPase [Candidatus Rokuibacteriota bacterium]
MYLAHFGLRERPFSNTPDPRFVYLGARHEEALAHLLYGVQEHGGFVQLTGEIGTGKTTVCRLLLERLPEGVDAALILNPVLTPEELLATVCDELDVKYEGPAPTRKMLVDALYRHLLAAHAGTRRTVLIVDEAQNLTVEALEQLRLLTNLETATQKLLQIILIGQPELTELLERRELRQLSQRITARYHLLPFTEAGTAAYVRHRVVLAGGAGDIFDRGALHAVYRRSGGVPRLINVVCDRALLGAYAQRRARIDRRTVRAAAREVLGSGTSGSPRRARWPLVAAAAALLAVAGVGAAILGGIIPGLGARLWSGGPLAAGTAGPSGAGPAGLAAAGNTGSSTVDTAGSSAAATAGPSATGTTGRSASGSAAPSAAGTTGPSAVGPAGPSAAGAARPSAAGFTGPSAAGTAGPSVVGAARPSAAGATGPSAGGIDGPSAAGTARPPVAGTAGPSTAGAAGPSAPGRTGAWVAQTSRPPAAGTAGPRVEGAAGRSTEPARSAPSASVAKTAEPGISPTAVREAAPPTLAQLLKAAPAADRAAAFTTLFARWRVEQHGWNNPCQAAAAVGLECLGVSGGWSKIRRLDLPAVLKLVTPDGTQHWAALVALDADKATVNLGARIATPALAEFDAVWDGRFEVLWQPPPIGSYEVTPGSRGKPVVWLRQRLDALDGSPGSTQSDVYDDGLRTRVLAFQRGNALAADGIAGVETLARLGSLVDQRIPSLSRAAR